MDSERKLRDDKRAADAATARGGSLARLDELDNYEVADGSADIRGWEVRMQDGRKVGEVEELIVDPAALKARYIEVKLEKDFTGTDDDRWALIPIGTAQLDEKEDEVIVDRIPTAGFMTREERDRKPLSRETELSLRELYGATSTGLAADAALESDDDFYSDTLYDDVRLRQRRRDERPSEAYLTRDEDVEPRL
ncbi:MAG TPA: PRC-barrel domain-containing protein [Gemmatimonadaceae bacterium]|nr:PRC-barrel domain-containing protein [Gemmatimonadaceae bacterium]